MSIKCYLHNGIMYEVGMRLSGRDYWATVQGTLERFNVDSNGDINTVHFRADPDSRYIDDSPLNVKYQEDGVALFFSEVAVIKQKTTKADYVNCKDYGIF
jgi:hypothetical protein